MLVDSIISILCRLRYVARVEGGVRDAWARAIGGALRTSSGHQIMGNSSSSTT